MAARTKLVVGLGNPGAEYAGTRHNIGFAVLSHLADRHGSSFKTKTRFAAEVAELVVDGDKIVCLKPLTFMNRSGKAVAAMAGWLKLTAPELLVVVDDADLALGQLRLRESGGSGGHNGLRSIIEFLGGDDGFARLRVGIGRRGPVGADITDHVLGRFDREERPVVREIVERASDAVVCCVKEGLTTAMNRFNRKAPPETGQKGELD